MRRWCAEISCAAIASIVSLAGPAAAASDDLDAIEEAIESLHIPEARELVDDLAPEVESTPRARYLAGALLFHEGRYREALAGLRSAIEGARAELDWKLLRDRVALAEQSLGGLETTRGESGLFVFRHARGADATLVSYADRALASQAAELEDALGDRPWRPLEVCLVPDVETLSAASGLTEKQIERTGTVGVSKWGRIIALTPRALAAGYPWLDTLAHELTHVVITRVSGDRAPIWLHEGIAKLYERRWRGEPAGDLTPEEAYLLDRAVRERRLIPLRRFHPSVAALPNQEDAALAYAQVLSFVRYLDSRLPERWSRDLLLALGRGETLEDAVADLSKFDLKRLYLWWKQVVGGRRQTPVPAVGFQKRRFKRGAAAAPAAPESVLGLEERRHLRLGDLLRLRGHTAAAATEFKRALALAESPSPEIADRLAGCLLDLGEMEEVADMLGGMADLYPSHSTVFVQLGKALAGLGRDEEAVAALERANALNPFHPDVHCMLGDLYGSLGRDRDARLEAESCRTLAAFAASDGAGEEPQQHNPSQ